MFISHSDWLVVRDAPLPFQQQLIPVDCANTTRTEANAQEGGDCKEAIGFWSACPVELCAWKPLLVHFVGCRHLHAWQLFRKHKGHTCAQARSRLATQTFDVICGCDTPAQYNEQHSVCFCSDDLGCRRTYRGACTACPHELAESVSVEL